MVKLRFFGFDWDEGNIIKCQKHGVSIDIIERVFHSDDVWILPDIEHSHAEDRSIAIALVDARYVFVVFTMRENLIRPVSARYMHKEEVNDYEEKTNR